MFLAARMIIAPAMKPGDANFMLWLKSRSFIIYAYIDHHRKVRSCIFLIF